MSYFLVICWWTTETVMNWSSMTRFVCRSFPIEMSAWFAFSSVAGLNETNAFPLSDWWPPGARLLEIQYPPDWFLLGYFVSFSTFRFAWQPSEFFTKGTFRWKVPCLQHTWLILHNEWMRYWFCEMDWDFSKRCFPWMALKNDVGLGKMFAFNLVWRPCFMHSNRNNNNWCLCNLNVMAIEGFMRRPRLVYAPGCLMTCTRLRTGMADVLRRGGLVENHRLGETLWNVELNHFGRPSRLTTPPTLFRSIETKQRKTWKNGKLS